MAWEKCFCIRPLRQFLCEFTKTVGREFISLIVREIHSAYEGASATYMLLDEIVKEVVESNAQIDKIPIGNYDEFVAYLRLLAYCLVKKQPMCMRFTIFQSPN